MKELAKFADSVFNPAKSIISKARKTSDGTQYVDFAQSKKISSEDADVIAKEVLEWAKTRGVTHYTFWVQPFTNQTIEKHEAFSELEYVYNGSESSKRIDKFDGKTLTKGEGDGSSVPHGGLRGTEAARAYIAWDHHSNMFIRQGVNKTLYIPAMLFSHSGQVLDQKTFLLRASERLKHESIRLLLLLGETEAQSISFSLGVEQEFFVIKKVGYQARLDLHQTGTALYGTLPPCNQQMSDHYYGKVNDKVFNILNEAENTLLKLGVPVKTKHKEVAVNQYEISCFYAEATTSVEHNLLTMDVLRSIFDKHGYVPLFSEKPFKHANGSGKHCNWSVQFNKKGKYENLFEPGNNPQKNLKFLLFILATLKAVQTNGGLVKASITSASNEKRMGGHEAPPCIISVFLGSYVDRLLNSIEKGEPFSDTRADLANLIPGLSSFMQDNTDRNRTCPFAFTGNKFEFRAVGSKQNVSFPMTVIATTLSKQIAEVSERLQNGEEVWSVIKSLIAQTKRIRFEGNGYSEEWKNEAEKRGLLNLKTANESYEHIKNAKVLTQMSVFTEDELSCRYNVVTNAYCNASIIDAETICLIASQQFIPRTIDYVVKMSCLNKSKSAITSYIQNIEYLLEKLMKGSEELKNDIAICKNCEDMGKKLDMMVDLRLKTDNLSDCVTEIELVLPKDLNSPPQLVDILNKY